MGHPMEALRVCPGAVRPARSSSDVPAPDGSKVSAPHRGDAAACIDDVAAYPEPWEEHLRHLAAVPEELRAAGLTANPPNVHWGKRTLHIKASK